MDSKMSDKKSASISSVTEGAIRETRMLVKNLRRLYAHNLSDAIKIMHQCSLLIAEINKFILLIPQPIEPVKKQAKNKAQKLLYLTSSLFLKDCFDELNQNKDVESLIFVTGPEIKGIKVLDKIVNLRLEHQSFAYAKADSVIGGKVLIHLSKYKFKLWGYFHIHPGTGIDSTFLSATDLALEKLLDKGYGAVGAIFSRDGHIRFFSSKQFEIQIYGEGVEKVNEKLYRLVEAN